MKKLLQVLSLVLLGWWAWRVGAEECTKCHYPGNDRKAPAVPAMAKSAHGGLTCQDCHPGDEALPMPPTQPAIGCAVCHPDEVSALQSSSHGKKVQEYLKKKNGDLKLKDLCGVCHGDDLHHFKPTADALSPVNRINVYKTCLSCHAEVQPIAIANYVDSIHGVAASGGNPKSAVCTDCHGSHFIEGMTLADSPVFYTTIPETCSKCHPKEYSEYTQSKHWKVVQSGHHEAPVCTNCHGEHGIRSRRDPQSPSWAGNVTQTCSHCHESELINAKFMLPPGMVKSFLDSYHGLSGSMGDVRVANCSSCHGNHDILPSTDPRSTVNPRNLGNTCGGCHPGAEKRLITEPIHKMAKDGSYWLVGLVRNLYILLIIFTVGGMLSHNAIDLYYKSARGEPFHRKDALDPRLTVNERIQHLALAVSFILLAYSGFCLRYSDSFFAQPFVWLAQGAEVRSWLHRGAAALFVVLAGYHLFYLALTERGRAQVKMILPRPRDFFDLKAVFWRYLGWKQEPFELSHYTYVEKAEYWALVWGGLIMTATGGVLLFTDSILALVPLWVVDLAGTVHFYEAVLAVSAILVWHAYWTIFDPEYYPMNLTWIFGRPRRQPKSLEIESKEQGG